MLVMRIDVTLLCSVLELCAQPVAFSMWLVDSLNTESKGGERKE